MSKIYNVENQLILRVPEEVGKQINQIFESKAEEEKKEHEVELTPMYERDKDGTEQLKFDFRFGKFISKATLVELPCIIESHRTLDNINFFKSNDICQMIYVHPKGEERFEMIEKSRKIARKIIKKTGDNRTVAYYARDGLTAPTKCIRSRFYRKKLKITPEIQREVKEIEREFMSIFQQLTRHRKPAEGGANTLKDEQSIGDQLSVGDSVMQLANQPKAKRKYKKKYCYSVIISVLMFLICLDSVFTKVERRSGLSSWVCKGIHR